jgi:hypothetical protein
VYPSNAWSLRISHHLITKLSYYGKIYNQYTFLTILSSVPFTSCYSIRGGNICTGNGCYPVDIRVCLLSCMYQFENIYIYIYIKRRIWCSRLVYINNDSRICCFTYTVNLFNPIIPAYVFWPIRFIYKSGLEYTCSVRKFCVW